MAISSDAANRRFQTVWRDYEAWLSENPSRNPEEYLADLPKHGRSADWALNKGYVFGPRSVEATEATEAQCPTLSFPDLPVPARAVPPFEWAVELIGAALAIRCPLTQPQRTSAMEHALRFRSIALRTPRFGARSQGKRATSQQ